MYDFFKAETNCIEKISETFTVQTVDKEYHHTLYYYDLAGNLIQTVPPAGVKMLSADNFDDGILVSGDSPEHKQVTQYHYNSIGSLLWQSTPDASYTEFDYDYAGRLRFSQDARQREDDNYSFTTYDQEGRIFKTGELINPVEDFLSVPSEDMHDFEFPKSNADGTYKDVVTTQYSRLPNSGDPDFDQENLQGRVVTTENDQVITRYSYDTHGNVKDLQHEILDFDQKYKTSYSYDLISGNVNEVKFQEGEIDEFYHRYRYDADNRLTHVFTSDNHEFWEEDARYFYYKHGPLARVEIGEDKVQGMDYYYTLHGWIKGMNQPELTPTVSLDPGQDGALSEKPELTDPNKYIARDVASYGLGYFDGDYSPIGIGNAEGFVHPTIWQEFSEGMMGTGLYNGNIAWMATHLDQFNDWGATAEDEKYKGTHARGFTYDQLHRIKSSYSFKLNGVSEDVANPAFSFLSSTANNSNYSYDPNGNIQGLYRTAFGTDANGNTISAVMDELSYIYKSNYPNRLLSVVEKNETDYLFSNAQHVREGQLDPSGNDPMDPAVPANYEYDEIGNLIGDNQEGITDIIWNVFGKVEKIEFSDGREIEFTYDPAGNRLTKTKSEVNGDEKTSLYIRDASGNLLSLYENKIFSESNYEIDRFDQIETPIYGSSRVGLQRYSGKVLDWRVSAPIGTPVPPEPVYEELAGERGLKFFEISNHLGNVLSVFTDRKNGFTDANNNFAYRGSVESATDYFPFGLPMPERSFSNPGYRYGFNGKEKDESGEWGSSTYIDPNTGEERISSLTHYDYGFRIYNPGIGRFLSKDPLTAGFPWWTPYQFAGNIPIRAYDIDGLEPTWIPSYIYNYGNWEDYSIGGFSLPYLHNHATQEEFESATLYLTFVEIPGMYANALFTVYGGTVKPNPNTLPAARVVGSRIKQSLGRRISSFTRGLFKSKKNYPEAVRSGPIDEFVSPAPNWGNGIGLSENVARKELMAIESKTSAHFRSAHGAQTTLEQQKYRATKGLPPDGKKGKPVNSTRFLTEADQLDALKIAQQRKAQGLEGPFKMNRIIGEGYLKGGQKFRQTDVVQPYFDKSGNVTTLFPKISK